MVEKVVAAVVERGGCEVQALGLVPVGRKCVNHLHCTHSLLIDWCDKYSISF